MNELIKAIEAMKMNRSGLNRQSAFDDAQRKAIELINAHMVGKVLAPVEHIKTAHGILEFHKDMGPLGEGWASTELDEVVTSFKAMIATIGESK